MFKKARIKLTAWYLGVIMAVSLSFSVAIYAGVNRELIRMDNMRRERQNRVELIESFIVQRGFPVPQDNPSQNQETLEQARNRIIAALGFINLSILVLSGIGGYMLAGLTLDPIQKMVKEQKEFVGNASHELRTPLTSLKTEMEVAMRDRKMTLKRAKELLKSNLEEVTKMQKLSNYLLKLNHYESKDGGVEMSKFDLGKTVLDALDSFIPQAGSKGIKIVEKIERSIISSDKESVAELTSIFIDNAIKYSDKSDKIIVSAKDGKLSVQDYGMGIQKEDIPHIFDRFYRADASRTKTKTDGYGLGLSIAKSIADRLNAKISVQSKIGKGSTFSIKFPEV